MKKVLRIFALLTVLTMGAVPAFAQGEHGVYLGIKFIDSIQSYWGDDFAHTQNTVGGGIFAGYDFMPKLNVPLRAEIEYAIRSNWNYNDEYSTEGVTSAADMSINMQTLLANIYFDWHNESMFTPYLGAGAGVAFVNYSGSGAYSQYAYHTGSRDISGSKTNFAWQVGTGVGIDFTDHVTMDLGYRYISFGDLDEDYIDGFMNSHELSVGLRFTF